MVQWLTQHFQDGGWGLIPGWGTKIQRASQCGKKNPKNKKTKTKNINLHL